MEARHPDDRAFPGGHSSNCLFASPVLADGGKCCCSPAVGTSTGWQPTRRTPAALAAASSPPSTRPPAHPVEAGVGPEPGPLDPPVHRIRDALGRARLPLRPVNQFRLVHPVV
ncbi:MAG: hypothetical protein U0736_08745 [Gemmataceae bacterium]